MLSEQEDRQEDRRHKNYKQAFEWEANEQIQNEQQQARGAV